MTSGEKLKQLSSILEGMGQALFASVVLQPILTSGYEFSSIVWGAGFTFAAYAASVFLVK